MLITLDIKNESKKESFLNFLATLDYVEIKSLESISSTPAPSKENKFKDFTGLWENKDVTLKSIRQKAYQYNHCNGIILWSI